jgi:hypothetical protein
MEVILLLVSLVNWHSTFRLEHSVQLLSLVASHLTFLSRQASQLGSFLLSRYTFLLVGGPALLEEGTCALAGPGVAAPESLDGSESRAMMDPAVTGA